MSQYGGVEVTNTSLFRGERARVLLERGPWQPPVALIACPRPGWGWPALPTPGEQTPCWTAGMFWAADETGVELQLLQKVQKAERLSLELSWGEPHKAVSPSSHCSVGWEGGQFTDSGTRGAGREPGVRGGEAAPRSRYITAWRVVGAGGGAVPH